MIHLILLSLISTSWSAAPLRWGSALEIIDRHEFYQSNVPIVKPRDAWQVLFSVAFLDKNLQKFKDCVYYRIPGEQTGRLKIKTMNSSLDCQKDILNSGDKEIENIKSLQFNNLEKGLVLHLTFPGYKNEKWEISFGNEFLPKTPTLMTSSSAFKAPGIILIASGDYSNQQSLKPIKTSSNPCHDIDDNCQERSPSTCTQCDQGWYEIPNGCEQGPKYCGIDQCGQKNQPACRRGMRYQRKNKKYECRGDISFVYCSPGLVVQCEANLAYCR